MRRLGACLAVTVTVLGIVAVTTSPADAAPTPVPKQWSTRPVPLPDPPPPPDAKLRDVSCPTAGFCIAVGTALTSAAKDVPLVLTRDRSGWHRAARTGLPRGIIIVRKIDCASPTMCMALTGLASGRTGPPVRWTGSGWRAVPLPRPGRDHAVNVACADATSCMAVGRHDGRAWSWHWNGSKWTSIATRHKRVFFADVSCPGHKLCIAVGRRIAQQRPPSRAIVSRWTGGTWSLHDLELGKGGSLAGIDCVRRTACTAVGTNRAPGFGNQLLVETLRGGDWHGRYPDLGMPIPVAIAVSCRTAQLCSAVFRWLDNLNEEDGWTVAARAPGGKWHARRRHGDDLSGVACQRTTCTIVGTGTLVLRGPGAHPTPEPVPAPGGPATGELLSMSCTPGGFCAATSSSRHQPLIHPVGGRWRSAQGSIVQMWGVSCVSATFCMAVGATPGIGNGSAAQWNGTRWSPVPMPRPGGRADAYAVDCVSATWCMAVGFIWDGAPLVEHWDGSQWHVLPAPGATNTGYLDVDCVSTSACLAVGSNDLGNGPPVAARWDGSAWQSVGTGQLPGTAAPDSVSCWSATRCLVAWGQRSGAVGRWNGTTFRISHVAHMTGPRFTPQIEGVACRAADDCLAVGRSGPRGHSRAALQAWDGRSWHVVDGPAISGVGSALLTAACGTQRCWLGGYRALVTADGNIALPVLGTTG
jgi:hypothetical protein